MNKASALAEIYRCEPVVDYYSVGSFEHDPSDVLVCCVDNNRSRRDVLEACDSCQCRAILAANEVHSSEAYYYEPSWRGTDLDPRVYYPEIQTDGSQDPRARAAGCTGKAQANNRQLVTANLMASSLAMHMVTLWVLEYPASMQPSGRICLTDCDAT